MSPVAKTSIPFTVAQAARFCAVNFLLVAREKREWIWRSAVKIEFDLSMLQIFEDTILTEDAPFIYPFTKDLASINFLPEGQI